MTEEEFIEAGAAMEHARWARWQRYLHDQCLVREVHGERCLLIPAERVRHWERQIATPYAELSEREKESDRKEVREYLPLARSLGKADAT